MAKPVAAGAGAGAAAAGLGAGAGGGAGGGADGGAAASEAHCALRKSFHFMPFREPASLAALYFALHSVIVSAWADVPCRAMAASTAAAPMAAARIVMAVFLR